MEIKRTNREDIDTLMPIFEEARKTIASLGIDQWQNGYPSRQVIQEDVKLMQSYFVTSDG